MFINGMGNNKHQLVYRFCIHADRDRLSSSLAGSVRIPACTATVYVSLPHPLARTHLPLHASFSIQGSTNIDKPLHLVFQVLSRVGQEVVVLLPRLYSTLFWGALSPECRLTSPVVYVDTMSVIYQESNHFVHLYKLRPNSSPSQPHMFYPNQ